MFNFTSGRSALLVGAAILFGTSAAYATPAVSSSTSINFGNSTAASATYAYWTAPVDSDQSSTGAPVTSSFSGNITGLNSGGSSQTMGVNGTAKASAEYGRLKTSSDLSLTTPFQNFANAPYVDENSPGVNSAGVPNWFQVLSIARVEDTLSLAAGSTASSLHLTFHLDGNIASVGDLSSGLWSQINVFGNTSSQNCYALPNCYFTSITTGSVDTDFDVILNVTDPSAIDLALSMSAINLARLDETGSYLETGNYALNADFYNTLELTGITAFDANGGQVTVNGLTGSSGTNYLALLNQTPPSNNGVPEPATLALFGAGLAGLFVRRRKRQN